MKYHWKKIRSAFMGLNIDKKGAITREELALYF
jgi:Ca2+-binding EF-hand superfamily protein